MKTQQEIEEMMDEIYKSINEWTEFLAKTNSTRLQRDMNDRKRQLMAQYNILLEVLK